MGTVARNKINYLQYDVYTQDSFDKVLCCKTKLHVGVVKSACTTETVGK